MSKFLVLLFVAAAFLAPAHARETWKSAYDILSNVKVIETGQVYRVNIEDLHPTQFAVGKAEIRKRKAQIAEMDKQELRSYLKAKIGSVIIGPDNVVYLVDGHHLASALLMSDNTEMLVKVINDWSKLSIGDFYERMIRAEKLWPYDEKGRGPLDPKDLPISIRKLRDDPFRSFAYLVRKAGGFHALTVPFQEFYWANFFRKYFSVEDVRRRPATTMKAALELAHSLAAADLPGYSRSTKTCEKLLSE